MKSALDRGCWYLARGFKVSPNVQPFRTKFNICRQGYTTFDTGLLALHKVHYSLDLADRKVNKAFPYQWSTACMAPVESPMNFYRQLCLFSSRASGRNPNLALVESELISSVKASISG